MENSLLEEDGQSYINRKNDKLFTFANEFQFFVSNHNVINRIISFAIFVFFICYQFISSLSPAPIDNPVMLPIDYLYAIFTGTISSPTKSMIHTVTLFFDVALIFVLILTFFIALYALITLHHIPFAVKTFAFFGFYLIPLFAPILLVIFSRSYIYLSIVDDHILFFLTLISNVLLYSILLLVGICNNISSYHITHVFTVQRPFQVVIFVFLIAIVHQLIGFITYSSMPLLIVSVLIQFAGVIYLSVYPLYSEQWMTIGSLTYFIFSFGISIARIIPTKLEIWIPFTILAVSFVVSVIISFLTQRIFFTKIGFLKNVFERKNTTKINVLNNILSMDLNYLDTYNLWQIPKLDSKISIEALELIYKKLESKYSKDHFETFFLFTLEQRIKSYKGVDISDFISQINFLKVEFWKAVWKSNYSSLSERAAKVGHDQYVFKQSLLFHWSSNEEMKEQIEEKFSPPIVKHLHPYFSAFHLACLLFFAMSLVSQLFTISLYRKSYSKFVKFTNIRDFLSYLTLVQIDLWPINMACLGKSFVDATNQWEIIKDYDLFESNFMQDASYKSIISDYLNSLRTYNNSKRLTGEVTDIRIFEIFSSLFNEDNRFFEQKYKDQTSKMPLFLYITLAVLVLAYICVFLLAVIIASKKEHQFFEIFQSLHKKDIKEFCERNFQYSINDPTEKLVPVPFSKIEWRSLKYFILSFIVSFLTVALLWCMALFNYEILDNYSADVIQYMDTSSYIALAFAYYSAGIFYENVSSVVPKSQIVHATRQSDYQFHKLFNVDSTRSLTSLIPESILNNLASYLYLSTITDSQDNIKNTIITLYSRIDLNDHPLYQNDYEFYLPMFILIFVTIILTVISYISQCQLNVLHYNSIDEKLSLIYEFKQSYQFNDDWKLTTYRSEELPLILLIASADMKIKFASKLAIEKLNVQIGNKITYISLDLIHSTEIMNAIHDMKNSNASDPVKFKKENGKFTIISPSFQIISCIKTLKSIVLIDDVDEPEESDDAPILECANPFFTIGSPLSVSFKNDQIALFSLKLIGLSSFIQNNNSNPIVVKTYLSAVLAKIDEFEEFARISVRNGTFLVVSKNITFSSVNRFVSVCADFGMKIQEFVASLSKQFDTNIYCSVLFHRCEAMTLQMSEASCAQSDFRSNVVSFIDECHSHFLMNAIGFVPRMKITQILNMSKIMSITLKNGSTADIFIFI